MKQKQKWLNWKVKSALRKRDDSWLNWKVFTKTGLLTEELKDLLQNKSMCSDEVKMSISNEKISAAIKSIYEGKASRPNEVTTSFLLGCEQEMLNLLLIIFSKSYDKGKIPEMRRYANMIPVIIEQFR